MSSANDALMNVGGTPWAKWPEVGHVVVGVIDAEPILRQSRDYDDGTPLAYPDGTPRMEIVVMLQTPERSDEYEDDTGKRQLVMRRAKNIALAVRQAVKDAGADGLEVGGKIAITCTGEENKTNSRGKRYTEKQFSATYEPPSAKAKATQQAKEAGVSEADALAALAGLISGK